jgi:uncharacterized protein YjdB
MKKIYFMMLFAFTVMTAGFAQTERIVSDFDNWDNFARNPSIGGVVSTEVWRENGGIVIELVESDNFPLTEETFNTSVKAIKMGITGSNQGFVFEYIDPAFDRSVHNAASFKVLAPGAAKYQMEMMNQSSANKQSIPHVLTDESTANEWHTVIFEIPQTAAGVTDLTKFTFKVIDPTVTGDFYVDDIKFFDYVKPAPKAIEITNTITELTVGKQMTVKLDFTPQEEGGLVDNGVSFETSNAAVLNVDVTTGALTAVSAGTATITATSAKDNAVTATKEFTVVAVDPANSLTLYNFETSTYVPSNSNYVYTIVDNPSATGINTSSKVLKVESSAAWAWHNWEPAVVNTLKVTSLKLKIFSDTDIPAFGVEFGINGVGGTTVTELTANTWTEVTVNIPKVIDYVTTFYIFPKDKWNAGTIYMDDIMLVAGDGAGYEPVSSIGALTGGSISDAGGTLTLTAPTVSPATATNKNFIWKIVSSDPADAATIDAFTGEITAVLNGTVEVKAISEDMLLETTATVTITGQGTGIKENRISSVKLYPNPAQNVVNIESSAGVVSARIYSLTGKVVFVGAVNNNQIDISSLTKGVYFVETYSADNKVSVSKLSVK